MPDPEGAPDLDESGSEKYSVHARYGRQEAPAQRTDEISHVHRCGEESKGAASHVRIDAFGHGSGKRGGAADDEEAKAKLADPKGENCGGEKLSKSKEACAKKGVKDDPVYAAFLAEFSP